MMILEISITGDSKRMEEFKRMPDAVHNALLRKVRYYALRLESYVKRDKLSGKVLNRKTGRLLRAIGHRVEDLKPTVWGYVFASSDVPYAGIHEFGGKTRAHIIVPKKASVLAFVGKGSKFVGSGDKVFATKVNHPGSVMPERSYLRSSLREKSVEISTGIKKAVIESVKNRTEV